MRSRLGSDHGERGNLALRSGRGLAAVPAAHARLLAVVAALGLCGIPAARAHTQFAPSTVNRYGKLVLSRTHGLRVLYTLMVGDAPALTLRTQADRSHDGTLDPQEQALLCARLGAAAREGLTIVIDQRPVAVAWDPPQCTLSGNGAQASDAVAALPIAMDQSAPLPLPTPSGPSWLLRYEDRVALSPVGEVELRIEESPDLQLLATWQGAPASSDATDPTPQGRATATQGATPDPVQRVYQTFGPPRSSMSDRSISLRFALASQPALLSRTRLIGWQVLVGVGAVLVIALSVLGVRFRSRLRLRPSTQATAGR